MTIMMLGIDLGKNSCSVAGLDAAGKVVLLRRMQPKTIVSFASKLPPCVIAMEACCGAHHLGHFSIIERNRPVDFAAYLISDFSWQRFSAISLWILVLFLIYVTASEFSQLLGPAEMRRLMFAYRPSELQLNRRQRARELMRLNRLADEHEVDEFRNPASAAHHQLVSVERLARAPSPGSLDRVGFGSDS